MTPTPETLPALLTAERLAEIRQADTDCEPKDGAMRQFAEAECHREELLAHLAARDEQMRQALAGLLGDADAYKGGTILGLGINSATKAHNALIRAAAAALGLGEL